VSLLQASQINLSSANSSVTNWVLIKNVRVIFACLAGTLAFFTDTQLEPIFSQRLEEFNMSTFQIGLMFTLIPATYIPSMLLIPLVRVEKRIILIVSAFLLGVATFLNGPSEVFHMPDVLYLIMMGQAFSGIFIACLSIPALPEMINASSARFDKTEEHRVHSLCSGLYNASLGLGQTLGPILSSALYAAFGFRVTQDIIGFTCIFYAIIYLLFGLGFKSCRRVEKDSLTQELVPKTSISN